MKLAILIDGGYYYEEWREAQSTYHVPPASEVMKLVQEVHTSVQDKHSANVRLLRTYYYDAEPFGETLRRTDGTEYAMGQTATYKHKKALLGDLRKSDNVAVRCGQLKFRGWKTDPAGKQKPDFQQKGVDMKIGLDVAWLATKRIVDVIVLVTGDTDFIAPMKLARTEGVEVWLWSLRQPTTTLVEHADIAKLIPIKHDSKFFQSGNRKRVKAR